MPSCSKESISNQFTVLLDYSVCRVYLLALILLNYNDVYRFLSFACCKHVVSHHSVGPKRTLFLHIYCLHHVFNNDTADCFLHCYTSSSNLDPLTLIDSYRGTTESWISTSIAFIHYIRFKNVINFFSNKTYFSVNIYVVANGV